MAEIFELHKIAFEDFCSNPHQILGDPKLVIKIEDQYYSWNVAAPLILSLLAFKQPLPS